MQDQKRESEPGTMSPVDVRLQDVDAELIKKLLIRYDFQYPFKSVKDISKSLKGVVGDFKEGEVLYEDQLQTMWTLSNMLMFNLELLEISLSGVEVSQIQEGGQNENS